MCVVYRRRKSKQRREAVSLVTAVQLCVVCMYACTRLYIYVFPPFIIINRTYLIMQQQAAAEETKTPHPTRYSARAAFYEAHNLSYSS